MSQDPSYDASRTIEERRVAMAASAPAARRAHLCRRASGSAQGLVRRGPSLSSARQFVPNVCPKAGSFGGKLRFSLLVSSVRAGTSLSALRRF